MLHPTLRRLTIAAAALLAVTGIDAAASHLRADAVGSPAGATTAGIYRTVKLGLNKSLVIDLPRDARDVLVSNPEIADAVMRTPRRIYLSGVAKGQANIIVFDRAGQQIVGLDVQVADDTTNVSFLINRLIPGADVNVEDLNGNIVLSGVVRTALDARKAEDIALASLGVQNAPGTTVANTQGGSATNSQSAGNSPAGSSTTNSTQTTTSGGGPDPQVINLLSIEGEDQVHLKVTVAEVKRSIAKQLGINLSGAGGGGIGFVSSLLTDNPFAVANKALSATSVGVGYYNGDNNNILGTIQALDQTGLIKTLAEPTLTAISGESASFLAGGEFPVPTGTDDDGNVLIEYKPFGVALNFTPVVLSEGRISLRVKTEVSDLSSENAITLSGISLPSISVRRSETTMELPSGGSMVMGGLLQDTVRQAVSGFPGLSKLPVLGTLFRSRDFERNETELVIIVTPYLVKPVARDALAKPDDGFAPAGDGPANFLGRLNRVYGIKGKPAPAGAYRGTYGFIFE